LTQITTGGPDDRPLGFVLTLGGVPIPFMAWRRTVQHPVDGSRAIVWKLFSVGRPVPFTKTVGHKFGSDEERRRVLDIIAEALRAYQPFYGELGPSTVPVIDVVLLRLEELR
jgi:hypothetical protein